MKTKKYTLTLVAAYIGYIVQSMVINFPPLLFAAFSEEFSISVGKIGIIISVNFLSQLATDFIAAKYIDRIGYRRGAVLSGLFAFIGLLLLGILPYVMPAFAGILIATVIMAAGGGLTEVIISPILQSLPLKNKAAHMSLLHSFFCWGFVLTVLLSTLYFESVGIASWRFLSALLSIIPLCDCLLFTFVPIEEQKEISKQITTENLLRSPLFLTMLLFMFCGGAAEIAMSQWASYFAQVGLNVSKTVGDLTGPCAFAILMGTARLLFAKSEKLINLSTALLLSSGLCAVCYLTCALSPSPVLSLVACALCGFSVGLMWPGVLSLCASKFENGGGKMFALLAFAGDVGCTAGPLLLSTMADLADDLKIGILFVIIFPAIMLIGLIKEKISNGR